MTIPQKPSIERRQSRVPGGFETDDEMSPIKSKFDLEAAEPESEAPRSASKTMLQTASEEDSRITILSEDGKARILGDDSTLEEKAMQKQLMEMDSSFLPEISPVGRQSRQGTNDTFVFGIPNTESSVRAAQSQYGSGLSKRTRSGSQNKSIPKSSATPSDMYWTPAPALEALTPLGDTDLMNGHNEDTSPSETMTSSPTAAAVARTMSRAVSLTSIGGYETANDANPAKTDDERKVDSKINDGPTRPKPTSSDSSQPTSPTPTKPSFPQDTTHEPNNEIDDAGFSTPRSRKRPKYLKSRISSQRSSYSSYTTTATDTGSDTTLGADYALQSGGAVPMRGPMNNRPGDLSRTTSLGSMASSISVLSEEDKISPYSIRLDRNLDILDEEDTMSKTGVSTPKAIGRSLNTPTDTLIAQRVRDVQVPPTVAREIRDRHRSSSPEKRNGAPAPSIGRNGKNLTLKEQGSTIDRLVKENFDLKLKVTFMDDLLNKRSAEGVKEVGAENVELRMHKVRANKDARESKRTIRELERKLKEKSDQLAENAKILRAEKARDGPSQEELRKIDIEMTYLREKVSTYEVEMDRMTNDLVVREGEKRTMAEALRNVNERRWGDTDIGAREEMVRCSFVPKH